MKTSLWLAFYVTLSCSCSDGFGPSSFSGDRVELDDDRLKRRLEAQLRSEASGGFAGSIGVARRGSAVYVEGVGLCDREQSLACSGHSVYTIGSITKPITGTAIVALQGEGRLQLTDRLEMYLPNVAPEFSSITIEQLATHTAGLPDAVGDDWEEIDWGSFRGRVEEWGLELAPATAYRYSNVGYSYLGRIIEVVGGMGYEGYLQKRFFEPAGMTQTGYTIPQWDEERLAIGYRGGRRWELGSVAYLPMNDEGPYWHLRGNGGLLSTPHDMLRFHLALRANALSNEQRQLIWTGRVDEGSGDTFYSIGWTTMETDVGSVVWHDGGNGYFYALALWFLDLDMFVILFTNSGGSRAEESMVRLARAAVGLETD